MANMGYCRFENTLEDVKDCLEAIDNQSISSESENLKAKRLFKTVLEYCLGEGIIENFDKDAIDDMVNNATEKEDDED